MIDQNAVYLVKRPGQPKEEIMLAMDVQIRNGQIGFYDTNRGRQFSGELQSETDSGFCFRMQRPGQDPEEWIFTTLTLDTFNRRVRSAVANGKDIPRLQSTDDLHEWYRRKFINP